MQKLINNRIIMFIVGTIFFALGIVANMVYGNGMLRLAIIYLTCLGFSFIIYSITVKRIHSEQSHRYLIKLIAAPLITIILSKILTYYNINNSWIRSMVLVPPIIILFGEYMYKSSK